MSYDRHDESWKGEQLIVIPSRKVPEEDEAPAPAPRRRRVPRAERGVCKFSGCTSALATKGKTGLCRSHQHARGYCNCNLCAPRRRRREG